MVECGDELDHQFERERVAALGTVESEDSGGAFVGERKILVGHVRDFTAWANGLSGRDAEELRSAQREQ
jgi:hypothetical protein